MKAAAGNRSGIGKLGILKSQYGRESEIEMLGLGAFTGLTGGLVHRKLKNTIEEIAGLTYYRWSRSCFNEKDKNVSTVSDETELSVHMYDC